MRIVAGTARGRKLLVPASGTRPTSERAREALFNRLGTLLDVAGSRVLDLYAGSGAVGLEALSRGAAHARFVESDRAAAALIARNVRTVVGGDTARAAVDVRSVAAAIAGPAPGAGYDIVFADPPYAVADAVVDGVLARVSGPDWLVAGGVVVVERPSRGAPPAWPVWVEPLASKRYGEGTLWYGRAHGPRPTGTPLPGE